MGFGVCQHLGSRNLIVTDQDIDLILCIVDTSHNSHTIFIAACYSQTVFCLVHLTHCFVAITGLCNRCTSVLICLDQTIVDIGFLYRCILQIHHQRGQIGCLCTVSHAERIRVE